MPTKIEKDVHTGTETTGHEWDGIKELNTPLPRWWLNVFYATILFALGYYLLYPSWPTPWGALEGLLGATNRGDVAQALTEQAALRDPFMQKIRAASLEQIRSDASLLAFATAGGRALFADNCAPCHGTNGGGAKGYPNLADDDWLWGGDLDSIRRTIAYGARNGNEQARLSAMPRFGTDGLLDAALIDAVAEYVLSLHGGPVDKALADRGAAVFAENCASCHGDAAKGNIEMGAPNLTDGIWLYGGDRTTIVRSIAGGRGGSMPAWADRLDEATIKMLTVYVHALGGGR